MEEPQVDANGDPMEVREHEFLLPDHRERFYRADKGPQRMTFGQAVYYCGGWDAFEVAYRNGFIDEVPS